MKTFLFVISTHPTALLGDLWTDDAGGNLFVNRQQAERVKSRYHLHDMHVVPCGLDADLAQMGQLYNEQANRPTPQTPPSPVPSSSKPPHQPA